MAMAMMVTIDRLMIWGAAPVVPRKEARFADGMQLMFWLEKSKSAGRRW